MQFIDVRDLGAWIAELCERRVGGTFNATNAGVAWSELLESCRRVSGTEVELAWLPDDFLVEHDVSEWRALPMWFPEPTMAGANDAVVDRALAAGLRFRPLDDTVRGAFEDAPATETAGLTPEREAKLLAEWHARE